MFGALMSESKNLWYYEYNPLRDRVNKEVSPYRDRAKTVVTS